MKKKPQKSISTTAIILAVIASFLITILLYVGLMAFFDWLDTASESAQAVGLLIFMFGVIFAPSIAVALIVLPKLKRQK